MKLKTTKILKFSLICTFLYVNQVAQAITVDLGSIPFNHNGTTVNASIDRIGWLAATTIDGNWEVNTFKMVGLHQVTSLLPKP